MIDKDGLRAPRMCKSSRKIGYNSRIEMAGGVEAASGGTDLGTQTGAVIKGV